MQAAVGEREALAGRGYGDPLVRNLAFEAGKQFRRVNGHLHLANLRAALEREVAETVGATCHDDVVNVA